MSSLHINPLPAIGFHGNTGNIDLCIEVTPDRDDFGAPNPPITNFYATSGSVSNASAIWRNHIEHSIENRYLDEDGRISIKLKGSPRGLMILLHICHFSFQEVREDMPIEILKEVVLESRRYKCLHLLRPWARLWLHRLEHAFIVEKHIVKESTAVLSIAYGLGCLPMFQEALKRLIIESCIDGDGNLVDRTGCQILQLSIGFEVVDHISDQRNVAVASFLQLIKSKHGELAQQGKEKPGCRANQTPQMKPARLAMIELGLYPLIPDASEYCKSVHALAEFLEEFCPDDDGGRHIKGHKGRHYHCDIHLQDDVAKITNKLDAITQLQGNDIKHNAWLVGTESMSNFEDHNLNDNPEEILDRNEPMWVDKSCELFQT